MMLRAVAALLLLSLWSTSLLADVVDLSPAVVSLLAEFEADSERPFSAIEGDRTWHTIEPNDRSCMSCHSESLYVRGRHERTGKVIEPMAPSVNPNRLTEVKKIRKWFLRNCKWTFGRECTAQEKGDILLWLSDQ